uniref:Pectinesterase inhibitor domain-containing protein n=1 Tax=Arundo donax TaxID=35708 RepID=A0A0A9HDS1_ARUDO
MHASPSLLATRMLAITNADKHGLAVIAVKIAGAAAKSTAKHIDALKASEKDKKRLGCLSACVEVYSNAVDQTSVAANGIASGKTGGLQDAVTTLSAVLEAPNTCEEGFDDLDEMSPPKVEHSNFGKETAITLCVTSALLPSL